MGIKLDSQHIFELGNMIVKQLHECGIQKTSELIVNVTKDELKKIDEDLFYRREHDKNEEFTPSDKELIVNFDNLKIRINGQT